MAVATPKVVNSGNHLYVKVAGVTFGARQNILALMSHPGTRNKWAVWLQREPDNPADPNAIAVLVARRTGTGTSVVHRIGYLPRELAADLAGKPVPQVINWRVMGKTRRGLQLKLRAQAPAPQR